MEYVRYPLSALKGGSKSDFFAFEYKSTADRLRRCQLSSPASVGGNIDHTHRVTVDKCM